METNGFVDGRKRGFSAFSIAVVAIGVGVESWMEEEDDILVLFLRDERRRERVFSCAWIVGELLLPAFRGALTFPLRDTQRRFKLNR